MSDQDPGTITIAELKQKYLDSDEILCVGSDTGRKIHRAPWLAHGLHCGKPLRNFAGRFELPQSHTTRLRYQDLCAHCFREALRPDKARLKTAP